MNFFELHVLIHMSKSNIQGERFKRKSLSNFDLHCYQNFKCHLVFQTAPWPCGQEIRIFLGSAAMVGLQKASRCRTRGESEESIACRPESMEAWDLKQGYQLRTKRSSRNGPSKIKKKKSFSVLKLYRTFVTFDKLLSTWIFKFVIQVCISY